MGPLVPEIISNDFNLIVAFIVGIGFGFVLEQAGFSSTKKLVGLFYGYDFTVLKVFFTAGITAMVGVLILGHTGLLDLGLIYVNPTYLWSAIVGGLIMGGGFIIGGFCPGTSVCAMAIGKLDGLAFVVGATLGIFAFTEAYPLVENLYMAKFMGYVRMNEYLGISKELFAFYLTAIAIAAFYFTWLIENKVNHKPITYPVNSIKKYATSGGLLFVLIGFVSFTPSKQELIQMRIAEAERQKKCVFKEISADKLAYELIHNYYTINLIDVRSPEKYEEFHIPLAINIPIDSMQNREWENIFKQQYKTNIFYADVDTMAKKACLLARFIGNSENYILKETTPEFRDLYFSFNTEATDSLKESINIYEFRTKTAAELKSLEESLKNLEQPVKKEIRKIQGGCS